MAAPAATVDRGPGVQLALVAAVLTGALLAVQARLNGELAAAVGDALAAALLSFGVGSVCIAAAVLLRPAARSALPRVRRTPVWERLGGLGGAALVAVSAAAAPRLGVALLTVGLVAGQTGGGLLVDKLGLAPGGERRTTLPRTAGAVLGLVAVVISTGGGGAGAASPLLVAAVVGAGLLAAAQQAVNGRLGAATRDASVAALVNFAVGTAGLTVGLAARAAVTGLDLGPWPGADRWYVYLGGVLGVAVVTVAAAVVAVLGVLRLALATVAGQLLGGMVLDLAAPSPGAALRLSTVAGAALILAAVAVSGGRPR